MLVGLGYFYSSLSFTPPDDSLGFFETKGARSADSIVRRMDIDKMASGDHGLGLQGVFLAHLFRSLAAGL
jgi:hypothetical protein